MNWKITISRYKKKSKEIPKEFRRYSIAVGYVKKWEKMWHVIETKSFEFPWLDDDIIKAKARELGNTYFKNQPKQVLIYFRGELVYGKDNLFKFYFK